MKAYIIPDWLKIIAGLVIWQRKPETRVLLGLRSQKRAEPGKWALPTGLGAIRRDITFALAEEAPESLEDPWNVIQSLPKRLQQAFLSPGGFARAETEWYVQIPSDVGTEQFKPLGIIHQLTSEGLFLKIYFSFEWKAGELPKPAETEWPFEEVKFFSKKELEGILIAFECDKDLEKIFWRRISSFRGE